MTPKLISYKIIIMKKLHLLSVLSVGLFLVAGLFAVGLSKSVWAQETNTNAADKARDKVLDKREGIRTEVKDRREEAKTKVKDEREEIRIEVKTRQDEVRAKAQ